MAYTTIDDPTIYFNTKLYTGNNSTQSITNVNFRPDFTWIKSRSGSSRDHLLFDVIRTPPNFIKSNSTDAEITHASDVLTAFATDGFNVGANGGVNDNGETYASWNWLAGGTASSNTDGSITSSVSANTTAGFSIVSYTGNGTAGATVGHGLSSKPAMMIFKERNGVTGWVVYHHKNTSAPATEYLQLNSTNATEDYAGYFNDTEPTSSVFTLGNDTGINENTDTYIAYCFAEKKGYSKFGSYTGNGNADGTFVYTGFKPAFVIIKNTGATQDWSMKDNKRPGYNVTDDILYPNGSYAEGHGGDIDILSNGFKCRTTADNTNQNGSAFIYMAFAESPFVTSTGIPTTAR